MSGLTEILVLVIVILGVLILPRMMAKSAPTDRIAFRGRRKPHIGGPTRLALLISGIWLAAGALYFHPWKSDPVPFLVFGLGPVLVVWLLKWVFQGFKGP
jgi:hypothetical protein